MVRLDADADTAETVGPIHSSLGVRTNPLNVALEVAPREQEQSGLLLYHPWLACHRVFLVKVELHNRLHIEQLFVEVAH